jgi:hypothetical protein
MGVKQHAYLIGKGAGWIFSCKRAGARGWSSKEGRVILALLANE